MFRCAPLMLSCRDNSETTLERQLSEQGRIDSVLLYHSANYQQPVRVDLDHPINCQ